MPRRPRAPRPFIVGTLAEVVEQEPNNTLGRAQRIGGIRRSSMAGWAPTATSTVRRRSCNSGQTLVAPRSKPTKRWARRSIACWRSCRRAGRFLAFNHDEHGLDPQIVFTAPSDGSYVVRVFGFPSAPNQTIALAGGDAVRLSAHADHRSVRRLSLAAGGDARSRDARRTGRLERADRTLRLCCRSRRIGRRSSPIRSLGGASPLTVEPHATIVEIEPNDATAQPIELPVTITRPHRRPPATSTCLRSRANKGESLVFQLESRELGFRSTACWK